MPSGIGYNRDIPLAREGGPGTPQGGGKVGGLSPQEAVKILSLRVPERPAANALAPLPLLTGAGGRAAGFQGLDALLQGLMQAFPNLPGRGGFGRGDNPQVPDFRAPSGEAPRQQPAPNLPPPVIRPGEEPTPGDGGLPGQQNPRPIPPPDFPNGGFQPGPEPLPIPTAPDVRSPFGQQGRNPRLAEKYGWDVDSGTPLF